MGFRHPLPVVSELYSEQGTLLLYTGQTIVAGSFAGVLYRDGPKADRARHSL